uniref:Uncharacterized protein n=1 Tax=Setaria italica TaxID=4555 RepID=K4A238_SETIT
MNACKYSMELYRAGLDSCFLFVCFRYYLGITSVLKLVDLVLGVDTVCCKA